MTSPNSPSIYPCRVLNIFECPYAADNTSKEKAEAERDEKLSPFDTKDLFDLSEIAFRLELALTRAQVMTRSNDTIYEADFENNKVRKIGYFSDAYDLYTDDPLEEKLAEIERLSKVPIRNRDDIYHELTDRETLDNVLEQGLDEEHQKYKDEIVKFYMSIRSSIQKDSFNGQNSDATYNANNPKRRQQDTRMQADI